MYQALPLSECELYLYVLTGAVGMYQARPLSVVDVTARRWRPAGSVSPIRVSHEFTCLGAILRGAEMLAPELSVRVQLI